MPGATAGVCKYRSVETVLQRDQIAASAQQRTNCFCSRSRVSVIQLSVLNRLFCGTYWSNYVFSLHLFIYMHTYIRPVYIICYVLCIVVGMNMMQCWVCCALRSIPLWRKIYFCFQQSLYLRKAMATNISFVAWSNFRSHLLCEHNPQVYANMYKPIFKFIKNRRITCKSLHNLSFFTLLCHWRRVLWR